MAIDANSTRTPARPLLGGAYPLSPIAIRQVVRLCDQWSEGIRERATMADRYATNEAAALRSLAVAIDHAVADWAAEHGGAA